MSLPTTPAGSLPAIPAGLLRHTVIITTFSAIGLALVWLAVSDDPLVSRRFLLGVLGIACFVGLLLLSLRAAIVGFICYSALVGMVRRVVPDDGADIDALLIGIPLGTALCAAIVLYRGAFRPFTSRSILVTILLGLSVAGALNPLQGSQTVGFVGIAFFGVPMLWFFVGRSTVLEGKFRSILLTAAFVAVPIGLNGLLQARGLFLEREREILSAPGGAGSFLDGKLRPIGTMASTGEFARFCMIAAMIWLVSSAFAKQRRLANRLAALPFGLLLTAAVFSGVRVSLVTALVTLGLVVGSSSRLPALSAAAFGMAAVALVIGLLQVAAQTPTDNFVLDRQLTGLSDPTSPQSATFSKRSSSPSRSSRISPTYPLGRGTGLTTPAGSRLGEASVSTETDVGDVAASWGIPGLLAYLLLIGSSLRAAYTVARRRRDFNALAALAVIGVALTQWMNGGLYAVAPLVWLCLGWIDRQVRLLETPGENLAHQGDVDVSSPSPALA